MAHFHEDPLDKDKDRDSDTLHLSELDYDKAEKGGGSRPNPHAIIRSITIQEDENAARELRLRRQVSHVDAASRVVGEFR